MCLIVKEGCKPEIVQKDITCWKMVVDWDETRWMAPFIRTFHEYGKELTGCERLKVENLERIDLKGAVIYKGFHAYTSREEAEDNIPNESYCKWKVTECVIPKGAEYCMGMYNEIVANKMIVHKPKCVK